MSFQELQIIFNENSNQTNREFTNYLDKNLSNIISRARVYFKFIIATETDKNKLTKEGITKLPAIILKNSKPILGLQNIYKYIQYIMSNKMKQEIKTEEEILQDFMSQEIQNGVSRVKEGNKKKVVIKDESENDEFSSETLNRKIQSEQKKRGLNGNNFAGSKMSNMDEIYTPNRPNNLSMNDDEDINENEDDEFQDGQDDQNSQNNQNNPLNVFNSMADSSSNQDDDMMRSLLEKIGDS